MNKRLIPLPVVALAALFCFSTPGSAQILLTAANFAVLSGSEGVSNSGTTIINGNVGSSTSVSGFDNPGGPGTIIVNGSPVSPIVGGPTVQAELDLITAQNGLAGMATTNIIVSGELGGLTLLPGIYTFGPASVDLTGALFLNANGEANPVWVFNMQASLTTSSTSSVTLIGGTGNGAGVFWNAETGAITIGAGSTMLGNYLAATSITLDGTDSGGGRFLAQAAVSIVSGSTADSEGGPPAGNDWDGGVKYSGNAVVPVPEPAAYVWIVSLGALGLVLWRRRGRTVVEGAAAGFDRDF